ncbi:MAG TPA: D-aminoacyl-tRNA deacylase [Gammaproteobacteria bacterium]
MIGLLQRVSRARVTVDGEIVGQIGMGLLVLVGVERGDGPAEAKRLAERLVEYRVFPDDSGRMNRSLVDVGGAMLLVPQFTLAADTRKGTRAGFSRAADPADGAVLFDRLVNEVEALGVPTARGRFGASMEVDLTNVGPVTFWLHVAPRS